MTPHTRVAGRAVVTARRPLLQRAARDWPEMRDIDERTEPWQVRTLMRAQFRLALGLGLIVLAVVGGLPLLFACFPAVSRMRVAAIPVPCLVLGVCVQPVWIVVARWHLRRAERIEQDFAGVVVRS
jgi:hypothetical protein